MEDAGINPAALLRRHVSGDWGDIHPEDDGLNEGRLRPALGFSRSTARPTTQPAVDHHRADRSATTILRSEDY